MVNSYLSYGGFKWLKNVDGFDINSISEKSPIAYILKIDPEYPNELHALHNDYPQLQKNLQFVMTCCQIIAKKLRQLWDKIWLCDEINSKYR